MLRRDADGFAENREVREPTARLDVIDGLRGIAILLVAWFHLWQLSWQDPQVGYGAFSLDLSLIPVTGFLGVDLFFFLSGFCLFAPFARAHFDGTPRPTLGHFAYRRFIKIVPSYWLAILVAILIGYSVLNGPADLFRQVALHVLFVHTFFDDAYGSISGVLWSLGVEIQFYALFPLLAWAMRRYPFSTSALAVLIGSAARFLIETTNHDDPVRKMNQIVPSIDLFVSGMLAAYLWRAIASRRPELAARHRPWTAVAIAAGIAYLAIAWRIYLPRYQPMWPAHVQPLMMPLLDAVFVAFALGSLFATRAWTRIIANPVLLYLAAISYNLYLWHQVIAYELFKHQVIPFAGRDPHGDPVWRMSFTLAASALCLIVATAITYGFERPLMRLRPHAPRPAPAAVESVASGNSA